MAEHQDRTGTRTEEARTARGERDVVREQRVVRDERRRGGLGSFLGSMAKAGLWMVVGAVVAVLVLVALLLALIF